MNRRSFAKHAVLTAGALGLGGPLVISQEACKEAKSLAKWAGLVGDILTEMSPILNEIRATGAVALVAKALPVISSLKKAFEDNANTTAFEIFNNLTNPQTGIIVQIADALSVLQGAKKVVLLGLLAGAQVILRTIAANIQATAPAGAAATAAAVEPQAASSMINAAQSELIERLFAASKF